MNKMMTNPNHKQQKSNKITVRTITGKLPRTIIITTKTQLLIISTIITTLILYHSYQFHKHFLKF
jgi:hypothetical protein